MPYKNKEDRKKCYHRNREKDKIAKKKYYEKNKEACIRRSWEQRQTERYKLIQPIRSRISLLKKRYGLKVEDYDTMLKNQNNRCAICNEKAENVFAKYNTKFLDIDHCHKTNKIRGLLCRECNVLVGTLEKPKEKLKKAFDYIFKHRQFDLHIEHDPK